MKNIEYRIKTQLEAELKFQLKTRGEKLYRPKIIVRLKEDGLHVFLFIDCNNYTGGPLTGGTHNMLMSGEIVQLHEELVKEYVDGWIASFVERKKKERIIE